MASLQVLQGGKGEKLMPKMAWKQHRYTSACTGVKGKPASKAVKSEHHPSS